MKWNEEEEVGRRCVVDGVVIVGVDGVDGVVVVDRPYNSVPVGLQCNCYLGTGP